MNKHVLIVEDEHLIAYLMARYILESTDYKVIGPVDNSEEAIEVALKERPSCILMDVRIEGELDGIDAAKKIREVYNVPIIFTTGNSDITTIERANSINLIGFLVKPIRKEQLIEALSQWH